MGTVDRTRQVLSAYRSALVVGAVGAVLVTTAGIAEEDKPPPKVVADGHTITPPPVTVTETATVTAAPMQAPSPSETPGPSMLPSSLPSSVPPSISAVPIPSATPTLTPMPTLTPRNRANGVDCFVLVEVDHGILIKVPCKN